MTLPPAPVVSALPADTASALPALVTVTGMAARSLVAMFPAALTDASIVPALFCHSWRLAVWEAAPLTIKGFTDDKAAAKYHAWPIAPKDKLP